jgi:hypothetical protein
MADDGDAVEVETVLARDHPDVIHGASHVEIRAGPAAARFAEPPVFDVPRRDPVGLEGVGHRAKVLRRRVFSFEAAAVNQDDERMGASARGHSQLAVVTRFSSVDDALIRRAAGQLSSSSGVNRRVAGADALAEAGGRVHAARIESRTTTAPY